jgi:DNA-binding beta-propeller fold protein YncE
MNRKLATHRWLRSGLLFMCAVIAGLAIQDARTHVEPTERVGPLSGGGFLLNSGWTIRPVGQQVPVDTFPMSTALSPDGKYLLVLNGGYNPPSISVIDVANRHELNRTVLPDAWLGLAFAPRSNVVYVGGGSSAMVYELSFDPATETLKRTREFAAVPDLTKKGQAFIGDVLPSADGRFLYAADLYNDSIAVLNLQSGTLVAQWKTGRRPYRLLMAPSGRELIVSSWGDASVYIVDATTGAPLGRTRIGPHATDMILLNKPARTDENESSYIARLFVTAGNTNNVYSIGITRDGQLKTLESINVSMTPMHPLGMTPSAVAVDGSGTHLYVVCSDANAVAVVDISGARSRVLGFIPTGWYPTSIRVIPGNQIAILNGKGLGSRANPDGPVPTTPKRPLYKGGPVTSPGYVAHIQTGTVQILDVPNDDTLSTDSDTVLRNSPYRDELIYAPINDPQQAYFARSENHISPIQHVIYVIKENRTYDQVLGDLEKGNGDKSLVLFGEQVTPNLHELARRYVTFDNFYENADVSAEGHNWASAAIAPDYTVRLWPNEYAGRSKLYDFQGGEPANTPPAGYIWDNALQAGVTVRDYGEWATNIPLKSVSGPTQIAKVNDVALRPYVDMNYRSFDLQYPDVERAKEFIREWKQFDATGQAPQLTIMWLGNDHTEGTKAGDLTPISYAADNDLAVGTMVDAVSHSRFWSSTAIFIIEDDSQNGPDHVDSHRAPVWVISPYTRRGTVDSTMYNQTSVLRTIELIVGLRPLTHFDAAARPMFSSFSRQPDASAYNVVQPKVSLTDRNPADAPGAKQSARMDFSDADKVDDDELNAVLWRALKHSDPPPPTRSAFAK